MARGDVTETIWSPRFLGDPSVRMPCSQTPVGPSRLASEDDRSCGELLFPVAFALYRCLSPHPSRCLSASRRVSAAPGLRHAEGPGP
jgi:hypothetical protein